MNRLSVVGCRLSVALAVFASMATVAQVNASDVSVKLPPYTEVKLRNGARIILMEKHDVPFIAFSGRILGGSLADPSGKEGLAALTSELLRKGAGKRNAQQIAEAIDGVGGVFPIASGREAINFSGEFMARDVALMVELISDILRRPTLPQEEFEKVKKRAIEEIQAAKDSDPRALVGTYFDAFFFGSHPFGRPAGGSESSLATIAREDVLAYYKNHFGGDRLILALVGDFNAKEMRSRIENAFGDWPKAATAAPKVAAAEKAKGRRVLLVDKPGATQTYFWIGNLGIARSDPDRALVDVANTGFGGRFTSMLNSELRVKSGLTYGAGSTTVRHSQPGAVAITTYTKTESTEKAVDLALEVLGRFKGSALDADSLASVKSYVLGQFPTRLETGDQLAWRLADLALYGLDRSDVDRYGARVEAATGEHIERIVRRVYPAAEDLTFVFIGDAAKIREVVKKYGKVTEMKITDPQFAP